MNSARRTTMAAATAVVLATAGGLLTVVTAPASAATTCASPVFKRQFFANTTFSGTPKKTDCDSKIAQNWGTGAPASGLPSNNFGVRWTVTRDFGSGGPFALPVSAQDGIRIYLDNVRKVDLWKNVSTTVKKTVNVTIPSGRHTLRVDFVNWTGTANVSFAYTPRTSATVDKVKPLAPTGTSVTYDQATGKAKLTWAKNKEMDLAGYQVYRRLKGTEDYHKVSGGYLVTGTSFTETLAPTGAAYYYEVRAVDKAGNESAGSADKLVTTVDRTAPLTPVLSATDDPVLGVELDWQDDTYGVTYDVYRAASADGTYEKLGVSYGSSRTDETAPYGETSYYKVVAKDAAGNTATSQVVPLARPLAVPTMESPGTNAEETGITLRWKTSKAAPTQYRAYRWELSDADAVPALVTCETYRVGNEADYYPEYGCTDYSAAARTAYGYYVTSVDSAGRESAPSATVQAGLRDTTPPPAVTGLTHTNTEYGTVLEWDESPAPDLARYIVHRAPADGGVSGHEWMATLPPGTTTFTDLNVPNDEYWVYFVDAVDTYNNSRYTTSGSPLVDVANVAVNEFELTPSQSPEPTAPWSLTAAADESAHAKLSWTCTAADCTTAGFHVYRWDRAAAQYVRLTDVPLAADARTYTDLTTPSATTSHYLVSAVAANGSEAFSGLAPVVVPPSGA
ncbi:PA14 domain-containing protein [Streptomyces sp. NBC_01373]|uniref:PA14 domain-containing protein n=1 Tax=Streptomyces sp. NBC_01373 TaxID=2903843 RepID=UPI00225A767A|nr:PA14 domain-containing protein [Streptomyces sp. NBC_01373]MCX4699190.1 PA14 domain-containing protein [Streptomyces sp. NBC_01373]